MALLFSAVRITAGDDEVEFLVGGIPRELDDLEGWSAFDDFTENITEETEIEVHALAYLYGEGETVDASPEEVAYFMKRMDKPYTYEMARVIVREMIDQHVLDMVEKGIVTDQIVMTIGYDIENLTDSTISAQYHGEVTTDFYGRKVPKHAHGTANLKRKTSSSRIITKVIRMIFNFCVENGYGRCKIANLLTYMGIYTRDSKAWHEATIGHILHSVLYKGILKSGSTLSDVFPELQIISEEVFEMAQKLMDERINEKKETRTMPLNTTGQSLLSGNVFCGHCGGRLTLTTNGTVRTHADGSKQPRKRVRYVCYNKTRHRLDCNGQTGYTMHILDGIIVDVLHMIFDRMGEATEDEIVARAHDNATLDIKDRLMRARDEFARATKEYESLKAEVVKAVQGKSAFPMDILSELVESAKAKMLEASDRLSSITTEMESDEKRVKKIQSDYRNLMRWSEIFDRSDIATKKMITGYIINRVYVYSDYKLHIEFNMNMEQFLGGLEIPAEYSIHKTA